MDRNSHALTTHPPSVPNGIEQSMMNLTPWTANSIAWGVFCAYWLISSLRVKRTKIAENVSERLSTVLVLIPAVLLLFTRRLDVGPLRLRVVADESWIAWSGVVVTAVGVAFAIWARYCIGQFWSARVTLKEGHRLIRSGPYRFVRHPIYTGMFFGTVGTALIVGNWGAVLGVLLMLAAHSLKALREEALLITEFGEEYAAYRRSTGFLFPRLR
jgi:protein-S-isoprenylcysteine O-methyltransferase Ste14